ncbi:MAG: hypothetical protein ACI35W_05735 [Anaeroplasmataceae bacterium]
MFFLKIWIFKLNISSIFSLVLGIAVGLAIFTLVYLAFVLTQMNKDKHVINLKSFDMELLDNDKISKKERKELLEMNTFNNNAIAVEKMIKDYENIFIDKKLRGDKSNVSFCIELSTSLIKNIACIYYPNNKRPYACITIQEALRLAGYISNRVDELLDFNGLRFIRGIKLKTIMDIKNLKKNIEEWKIVKFCQEYKINKILTGLKVVLNLVNPLYWVRKFIIDSSIKVVTKKICKRIIGIAGEEAYKIYSKSVFEDNDYDNLEMA